MKQLHYISITFFFKLNDKLLDLYLFRWVMLFKYTYLTKNTKHPAYEISIFPDFGDSLMLAIVMRSVRKEMKPSKYRCNILKLYDYKYIYEWSDYLFGGRLIIYIY